MERSHICCPSLRRMAGMGREWNKISTGKLVFYYYHFRIHENWYFYMKEGKLLGLVCMFSLSLSRKWINFKSISSLLPIFTAPVRFLRTARMPITLLHLPQRSTSCMAWTQQLVKNCTDKQLIVCSVLFHFAQFQLQNLVILHRSCSCFIKTN